MQGLKEKYAKEFLLRHKESEKRRELCKNMNF